MSEQGEASAQGDDAKPAARKADQRSSVRIQTVYFVVKVTRDADAGLFRVCNISDTGMKLATHVPFEIGEDVLVELTQHLAVEGRVAWCEDSCCGIEFVLPIDCAAILHARAEQKLDPRGSALRLPVRGLATCYAENGIRAVRITDVSRRGVGLSHDGSLASGMLVKLILESGTAREGRVCWSRQDRAGVRLNEPLTSRELESARAFDCPTPSERPPVVDAADGALSA